VGGTCGTHGEGIGADRVLVGRPEGKRPLGRPRRRWEDNINESRSSDLTYVKQCMVPLDKDVFEKKVDARQELNKSIHCSVIRPLCV
jgi:hypothetical protein